MTISAILGAAATVLVIVGYMPQINHLLREQCTAGISIPAFSLWMAGATGPDAVQRGTVLLLIGIPVYVLVRAARREPALNG